MVKTEHLQTILHAYGLPGRILQVLPLEEMKEKNERRILYRVDLQNGLQLVCRISREERYPRTLIEQQCTFSEKLRAYGLPTARKYPLCGGKGGYVFKFQQGHVTLEQYVGADVDRADPDMLEQLGVLLGRMHRVSEQDPSPIDYAPVCGAIRQGRATFERILARSDPALLQREDVRAAQVLHDGLVCRLRATLDQLPHGAVHGDLGVFNNLVTADGKLSIIDFNLAADEPFLCDLLSCFYSSIHKYTWRDRWSGIDHRQALEGFLRGYASRRTLTGVEREQFCLVAALFDGLFYCKALLEEYGDTGDPLVLEGFRAAAEKFDPSRHGFPRETGSG